MKQEEIDARLFDLIESTKFENLSESERLFVLTHLSESDYLMQSAIHLAAAASETEVPTPLPLVLPGSKTVWYKRSIPLYQVISAAAVSLLFFWIMRNPETHSTSIQKNGNDEQELVKTQTIYDTIIREIPVIQTAIRYVHDTIKEIQYELYAVAPIRELQSTPEFTPVALTQDLFKSNAPSLQEDKSAQLLSQQTASDRFTAR